MEGYPTPLAQFLSGFFAFSLLEICMRRGGVICQWNFWVKVTPFYDELANVKFRLKDTRGKGVDTNMLRKFFQDSTPDKCDLR